MRQLELFPNKTFEPGDGVRFIKINSDPYLEEGLPPQNGTKGVVVPSQYPETSFIPVQFDCFASFYWYRPENLRHQDK